MRRSTTSHWEDQLFGLIGKIVATEGQRDALISILLEGSGTMPGCRSYVVARDPSDPDSIWVTEVWDDRESHQASLSLPEVRAAIARGKPLIKDFAAHFVTEPVGGVGIAG
jgi:quinol monooxygenase YgiN